MPPYVAAVLVLGFGALIHASYINNGFTWLDHIDIQQGAAIVAPSGWPAAFTTRYGDTGFYRPLVTLAHSLDALLYGQEAAGFHLTNVLLHLVVAVSGILFLTCFFPVEPRESQLAGLILVAHPLGWLPTGSISYRPELLVGLGTLLAIYFHTRARRTGDVFRIALTVAAILVALFSKETALVWIPCFILLWEVSVPRRSSSTYPLLRKAWPLLVTELGALVLYVCLRVQAVPETWRVPPLSLSLSQAVGTRLHVLSGRLLEMVSPLKPGLSDATPIVSMESLSAILCGLILLLGAGLVFRLGLRSEWSVATLFLAVAIAPGANLVPLPRFNSPHYGYLAPVGVAMFVLLTRRALARKHSRLDEPFKWAVLCWLGVMSIVTFVSGFQFADDQTLFGPEVARDTRFLEGHYYLGNYFMDRAQYDRAGVELEAALSGSPSVIAYVDRPSALINLAGVRLHQSRLAESEELLLEAVGAASEPQLAAIAYNRALVARERDDYASVVSLLRERDYRWERPEPWLLLASALQRVDRTQEAVDALRQALPLVDEETRRKLEAFIRSQLNPG